MSHRVPTNHTYTHAEGQNWHDRAVVYMAKQEAQGNDKVSYGEALRAVLHNDREAVAKEYDAADQWSDPTGAECHMQIMHAIQGARKNPNGTYNTESAL